MGSMCFDPQSGRLFLSSATFLALAAVATGRQVPPARLDELSGSGILVDGALHRAATGAVRAVTSPSAQLSIAVMEERACLVHQGWLGEVNAVLEDLDEDHYELLTVHPESMPATLARLARLSRRPTLADGEVPVSEDLLDALTASDPGVRRRTSATLAGAAPPAWATWAQQVWAGASRFVVVDVFWSDPTGQLIDRRIAFVDTEAGLTLVDASGPDLRLVPTTPRDVWTLMCGLLPHPSELHTH